MEQYGMKLLFSELLSSAYTWITPPDDVGDTLLATRENNPPIIKRNDKSQKLTGTARA